MREFFCVWVRLGQSGSTRGNSTIKPCPCSLAGAILTRWCHSPSATVDPCDGHRYARFTAQGPGDDRLSKVDVDKAAEDVMRDLQRTCACYKEKGVCARRTKAERPDDPVWKSYCPNAVTLEPLLSRRLVLPPDGRRRPNEARENAVDLV